MKKKLIASLLMATMTLSLAACGKGDGGSSGGSGGSGGGEEQYYNTYLQTEPSTLDSIKGNDNYSRGILINTMEPLTRLVEKDGEQVREAAGAESWESNEDGTVWTFKIRDNKWSDGQEVTAAECLWYYTDIEPGRRFPELILYSQLHQERKQGSERRSFCGGTWCESSR